MACHPTLEIYYCPLCNFKRQILRNKKTQATVKCFNCGYRYALPNYYENRTKKYDNYYEKRSKKYGATE